MTESIRWYSLVNKKRRMVTEIAKDLSIDLDNISDENLEEVVDMLMTILMDLHTEYEDDEERINYLLRLLVGSMLMHHSQSA